jgi:non-heme chloroperoxidase
MPYFKTADGTELFYSIWGTGSPVLLIHGGNIGSDIWEFLVPTLAEQGNRCIIYDQRGFARSDCPGGNYSFDTLASDLADLIAHLALDQFSAIGFSHGGCLLARYLSRYGSVKLSRVTLIATILPYLVKSKDNPDGIDRSIIFDPFYEGMKKDRAGVFRNSLDAFFAPATAEKPISDSMRDWVLNVALRASLMPMLAILESSNHTDFRDDLKSFNMPTLIIHGAADPFAPVAATALRTHQMIPGSILEIYEGASHGLLLTHQDRITRRIQQWLGAGCARAHEIANR